MLCRHSCSVRFVEVSVGLLGGADEVDDTVHGAFQGGVFLKREQVGGSLHHLVEVGGHEAVGEGEFALVAFEILTGLAQIVHGRTHLVESEGHKGLFLNDQSRTPEIVFKRHLFERYCLKQIIRHHAEWHQHDGGDKEGMESHKSMTS